jgi:hypothetical protein
MRLFRALTPLFALSLGSLWSGNAHAGEATRIATAAEEDNPFDFHFGASYAFDYKKAAILREFTQDGANRLGRDLMYYQQRQTVNVAMEIGIYRNLSLYVELPVVVADNRAYAFDQESGDCVYPEDITPTGSLGSSDINCVNKTNSSTIRDGILPRNGFDARNPASAYTEFTSEDTSRIFNGPTRKGIDQLHVGIKYGILDQDKQPHLPTWILGVEGRFAIGRPMEFSRNIAIDEPLSNSAVGRGTHELGAWTALSRRYRFLEPFFGAHWRYAFRASETTFQKFDNMGVSNPQSTTGLYVGAEFIPWENKAKQQKFSITLMGTADLKYGGRAYSEVWELLADSPALVGTYAPGEGQCNVQEALAFAGTNPADPVGFYDAANAAPNSGDCQPFSGITDVDDFARFGLRAAMNFHLGKYARLNFGADVKTDTQHFLTNANRGDPEAFGDPNIVEGDEVGVNPVRRDVVDNVGRRYAISNVFNVVGFTNFLLTF